MSRKGNKARGRPEPIEAADLRQVTLKFKHPVFEDRDPRMNLSAAAAHGVSLFVADDEAAAIHRLIWDPEASRFEEDDLIELGKLFELPEREEDGTPGEMDIEGLAVADDALWIVGSHSLGRKKPRPKDDDRKTIERLQELKRGANRHFLGRLGLRLDDHGLPDPDPGAATCLEVTQHAGRLSALLAHDPHLAPSIHMPAKENGFDIEGLAVAGERVFLGLRGPVLRGWAILLELRIPLPTAGRLDLAPLAPWQLYRKHFLDLEGLGIRELLHDPSTPDDLLVLAGPSMDLDGPVYLYRWRGALEHDTQCLVTADELGAPLRIPYGRGCDHAEAVLLLPRETSTSDEPELLILYDSPADDRLKGSRRLKADILPLRI
jgi:hypothetical protein